eukprot:Skav216456  [mRNA]  locus=scaffold50:721148:729620:- [translate_table: standard]
MSRAVWSLGLSQRLNLLDLLAHAREVAGHYRICPDDETVALAATDTALPVLNTVAVSASAVGLCGCAALIGVAGLYKVLRDQSRCSGAALDMAGVQAQKLMPLPHSAISAEFARLAGQKLTSKSMPCLRPWHWDMESDSDEEEERNDERLAVDEDCLASTFVRINLPSN